MFNIDFRHIIYNLTPYFLRSDANLSFLYSLVEAVGELNIIFNSFRDNTLYLLQFTSQIIYLEHYLNDQFDPIGRGIYIDNIEELDWLFLFNVVEQKPPLFIFNKAEAATPVYFKNFNELINDINFIINIPVAVTFVENVVRAKVDFYNQAGKNYTIVTY